MHFNYITFDISLLIFGYLPLLDTIRLFEWYRPYFEFLLKKGAWKEDGYHHLLCAAVKANSLSALQRVYPLAVDYPCYYSLLEKAFKYTNADIIDYLLAQENKDNTDDTLYRFSIKYRDITRLRRVRLTEVDSFVFRLDFAYMSNTSMEIIRYLHRCIGHVPTPHLGNCIFWATYCKNLEGVRYLVEVLHYSPTVFDLDLAIRTKSEQVREYISAMLASCQQ